MITFLHGKLVEALPTLATVEVHGVGYEVLIPLSSFDKLPAPGSEVHILTHLAIREDAHVLYGFATAAERDFFRLMIENVTGVGPKMALTIMSRLSLPSLENAIRMGDIPTLAKCQGIGKKTAERLVVELKSKVGASDASTPITGESETAAPTGGTMQRDAVAALIALGYRAVDADQAVRNASLALGPKATTEALIKKALS